MKKNHPLSPHLQIYSWHISSLVSISHRITGIINIIGLIVICAWIIFLFSGENNYEFMKIFFQSFVGKFFVFGLMWSYSFHTLSGIRHLIWDLGFGYELYISKFSGLIVILGSFFMTIFLFLIGTNLL